MKEQTLSSLLFNQVQAHPDADAIIHGDTRVSYAELWRQISCLAVLLEQRGITPGSRVVLLMDNSIRYVVAYYALLRLAAVVVPLNTGLKGAQLSEVMGHAEATLLLHDGLLHDGKTRELDTGVSGLQLNVGDAELLDGGVDPRRSLPGDQTLSDRSLATIIYTSGTTGKPKGIMLSAGNLLANCLAIIDYLDLQSRDRLMCVLPFYYAYGNSVLHTHLAAGATLILENSLMYPQRVLQRMAAEQVTGFAGVPSTFRLLLLRCDLSRIPLPNLRYITQAGGPLAPSDIERLVKCWPQARFFVMYGQTEATARLTYLPPDRLRDKAGTVGIPINGVRIKIMDEQGAERARGDTGEICAAGPNTMLGYWRDSEASKARFFDEWLRTGDLGYQDEEGFITIVGRASDMIKTGDHRVAPEEIEEIIADLPGVEEVAVVGIPDSLLGQVVKAYVVLAAGSVLDTRQILRHCSLQCAPYKIPKAIDFLATLPKTASGKIQRYQLLKSPTPTGKMYQEDNL
ncbi:MAG: class I adenylate-forming enzyme family protein [Cellvibrionaceae bacterium]